MSENTDEIKLLTNLSSTFVKYELHPCLLDQLMHITLVNFPFDLLERILLYSSTQCYIFSACATYSNSIKSFKTTAMQKII